MCEQKKKKKSMIHLTLKRSQSFFVYCIQSKKYFTEKGLFKEKGKEGFKKKTKRNILTALITAL